VRRLRWFDTETEEASSPVDWSSAALILATLFLNFSFWFVHGIDLPMYWPLPVSAGLLAAGALVITCLFFLGPALATQTARRPLFGAIENSLGSIPAIGLRLCCVVFLVFWIANLAAVPWLTFLSRILRREASSIESGIIAAGVLAFLFMTGVQSLRTSARLALFTNKLGVAVLVAALLRVHEGWSATLNGFHLSDERSAILELWRGLSLLAFYVAPLAFLASGFGYRSHGRRPVVKIALMGIALPLFGVLFLIGVINVATCASPFYQPTLNPDVAMALWGKAARSAVPGGMMVAVITIFGAIRFGARALADSLAIPALWIRFRWAVLGCLIGPIVWLFLRHYYLDLSMVFDTSVRCLAIAGAVLTADFMTGSWQAGRVRKVDGIGLAAMLAGLATPLFVPHWAVGASADQWWHPWLLPSYAVGLLVCLCGRVAQKMATAYAN
jgi:hypothetical protein